MSERLLAAHEQLFESFSSVIRIFYPPLFVTATVLAIFLWVLIRFRSLSVIHLGLLSFASHFVANLSLSFIFCVCCPLVTLIFIIVSANIDSLSALAETSPLILSSHLFPLSVNVFCRALCVNVVYYLFLMCSQSVSAEVSSQ